MSLNQVVVKRKKVEWIDKNIEDFLKVCIKEVRVRNKPYTHFNKIEKFNKTSKLNYEFKQFKNRSPKVTKFREQGLKFLSETIFPFKGIIVTSFATYCSVQDEELNLSSQLDQVLKKFNLNSGDSPDDPTSINACVENLEIPSRLVFGSDIFFIAFRFMKKRENIITFVSLKDFELQL
ncbi:hypothetical protein HKD37_06G016397 [Glycine soja]